DLRHRDLRGGILAQDPFAQQIAVKATEARQLTRRRTRLRAGLDTPRDVVEHVGPARAGELDVARHETLIQSHQVGAISTEGVLRQAALHPDRIEKAIDERLRLAGQTLAYWRRSALQKVMRHSNWDFVSNRPKLDMIQC